MLHLLKLYVEHLSWFGAMIDYFFALAWEHSYYSDHYYAGEHFRENFLYPRLPYIIILFFVLLVIFTFLFNKYSSRTSEAKITLTFTLAFVCSVFIGEALIYAVFFLMYLSTAYAVKQNIKKIRLISPEETIWAILMIVFVLFVGSVIIADYSAHSLK